MAGLWSQAGGSCKSEPAGFWLASMPKDQWPEEMLSEVDRVWDEEVGDCRQEIVLIGIDMPKDEIIAGFNSCLLTDQEMNLGPIEWKKFNDPFPKWLIDNSQENDQQLSASNL
jgi:hypothetical protein